MKNKVGARALVLLLTLCLALSLSIPALAASNDTLKNAVAKTVGYMLATVKSPQVGSIGGEWAVLGLARSGCDVPDFYDQTYYAAVEERILGCKGVLSEKKYTEYSRLILALTAIGKDPSDVAGYNLLTPLGDFSKTVWQGISGPIWALIALDAGGYAMPQNPTAAVQATRQKYVDEILSRQLGDGGWNEAGQGTADADITGMALQALAKYRAQKNVNAAVGRAVVCLSTLQNSTGGFTSEGIETSESVVQVIVGLSEAGISLDDSRFIKSGNTLIGNLLSYVQSDGSFLHAAGGAGSNEMATEQGLYGLVAALRAAQGKNSLYSMGDAVSIGEGGCAGKGAGLPGRNTDVKALPVTAPGRTFHDIADSDNRPAIEALAARGIVSGRDGTVFDPNAHMTRAEFAVVVTRSLGLVPKDTGTFSDVAPSQWYAGCVGTASKYGIVSGVGGGLFDPDGVITRQEAAVMVTRAAALCGMGTVLSASEVRDTLAQFGDYTDVAGWAKNSAAFCYQVGILDDSALNIEPTKVLQRSEIAQMFFNLLQKSNLI